MDIAHQGVIFFGTQKPAHLHNTVFRQLKTFVPQRQHDGTIIAVFEDHIPNFVKNWIMENAEIIPFHFFILPGGKEFPFFGHTYPVWCFSSNMNCNLHRPTELSYTSDNFGFWIVLHHSYEKIEPPWKVEEVSWHNCAIGRFTHNTGVDSSSNSEECPSLNFSIDSQSTFYESDVGNAETDGCESSVISVWSKLNEPGTENIEMADEDLNFFIDNIVE